MPCRDFDDAISFNSNTRMQMKAKVFDSNRVKHDWVERAMRQFEGKSLQGQFKYGKTCFLRFSV